VGTPNPKAIKPGAPGNLGNGVGQGHGGNSKLPPIREAQMPVELIAAQVNGRLQPGTKLYRMGGDITILVSPPYQHRGWHMSIAHPRRYPTWDEIAKARYTLLPHEKTFAQILPPPGDYVNIHNYALQIVELTNFEPY